MPAVQFDFIFCIGVLAKLEPDDSSGRWSWIERISMDLECFKCVAQFDLSVADDEDGCESENIDGPSISLAL